MSSWRNFIFVLFYFINSGICLSLHKLQIMKTQEQLDVLHELRLKGMSSVRDKAMIAEAMQRTDLPESCIKVSTMPCVL